MLPPPPSDPSRSRRPGRRRAATRLLTLTLALSAALVLLPRPAFAAPLAARAHQPLPTATVIPHPSATIRPPTRPTPTVRIEPIPVARIFLPLAARHALLNLPPIRPTSAPPRTRTPRPTLTPTPLPTDLPTATPPACPRPWRLGLTVLADGGFDLAAHPCDGLAAASAQREVAECPLPPMAVTVRAGGPDGAVVWSGTLEAKRHDTAVLLRLLLCVPPPYLVQAHPLGATSDCWAMCPGTAAERTVTQADFDAASATVPGEGRTAPVRWALSRVSGYADSQGPPLVYLPALRAPVAGIDGDADGGASPGSHGRAANAALACTPSITLVNAATDAARAVFIVWPSPTGGNADDAASGPSTVFCTEPLKTGAPLTLDDLDLPADFDSAYVVSLSMRAAAEAAAGAPIDGAPLEGTIADHLCRQLQDRAVGDPAEEARFRRAFLDGSMYAGLRLDHAYGGPLAVQVSRACPRPAIDGVAPRPDSAAYNGPAHRTVDVPFARAGDRPAAGVDEAADPTAPAYRYPLPAIVADGHRTTVVHTQNADIVTHTIELSLVDATGAALPCAAATLPPGRSRGIDVAACTAPSGTAAGAAPFAAGWVTAAGPVAIVVDIVGVADGWPVLASYAAPSPAGPRANVGAGVGTHLAAPLVYGPWVAGAELFVQNVDPAHAAVVTLSLRDRGGDDVSERTLALAPGGQERVIVVPSPLEIEPASSVRYLRLTSSAATGDPVDAPPIAAVVVHGRTASAPNAPFDPARPLSSTAAEALQAIREPRDGTPAYATRTGRLILPVISNARKAGGADGPVDTSSIAIVNHVDKPGFTDLVVLFFDRNGLLDLQCQKLNERQTEYIDLASWGFINPGFKGSVLISAVFWEHDVFTPDGTFVGNILDLGAAAGTVSSDGLGRAWTGAVPLSPDGPTFAGDGEMAEVRLFCGGGPGGRPGPQPQPTFAPPLTPFGGDDDVRITGVRSASTPTGCEEVRPSRSTFVAPGGMGERAPLPPRAGRPQPR